MSLKDFQLLEKLGQGAFSTVFKVKRMIDNQVYALKKVKMNNLTERQKQNALNEVRILASIDHPNIISYKQAFIQKGTNYLCIIMEFADDGDLLAKIKQYSKVSSRFQEDEVWSIFIQITNGLKVLHDLKILHRDIKSANIFLTKSGQAKLGDLNVSKMVKSMSQTQTGTPYYASPQIWKDQPYDKKSDIWSLGCVFYEMIALKPPFRANDMEGLYKKVSRGFYSRIPPQYSNDLSAVLKLLLQVAPHLRSTCGKNTPNTDKILEFPLVQKNMLLLPQSILQKYSKIRNQSLMNTIRIDERIATDELKNQVLLPKPRYGQVIQFQQQLAKSTKNISNFMGKRKDQEKQIRKLILPSINRTIDYDERNNKQKQQKYMMKKQINQLLGNGQVSLIRRGASSSLINKQHDHLVVNRSIIKKQKNYTNKKQSLSYKEEINDKRFSGRLRQLSPSVIKKILKQQKQRQKIKSIINN